MKSLIFLILTLSSIASAADTAKRKQIADLYSLAVSAFASRSYAQAIDAAEKIRRIHVSGNTRYLNEAKQIIDKSRVQQKDEFEPFVQHARDLYEQGEFQASYDVCAEMLKVDPTYDDAQKCQARAERGLRRADRFPASPR